MQVIYKGTAGGFSITGRRYINGLPTEVDTKLFAFLKKNYPTQFEFVEDEKPKAPAPKAAPKAKTTTKVVK